MNDSLFVRTLHPELAPRFSEAQAKAPRGADRADLALNLLEDACRVGASDLHIEPLREGARVRVRVDGAVFDVFQLDTAEGRTLVNQFKAIANLDPITRFTPRDAHASYESAKGPVDLRLALAPTLDRDALSIRLLDPHRLQRSISELGLSDANLRLLADWLDEIMACSWLQVQPAAEKPLRFTPCCMQF